MTPSPADQWMWFAGVGAASILLGILAWIDALNVSIASMILLGIAIVVVGVVHIVHALNARAWGGHLLPLVGGCLYVLGGVLLMTEPAAGSVFITAVIAICLMIAGITRLAIAYANRHNGAWRFTAAGGLLTLLIGVLLYASLPWSGLWLIGTLVAIELIVAGTGWLQIGLALRRARLTHPDVPPRGDVIAYHIKSKP